MPNREAELLDELEAAVRAGDKVLAWQIAVALTGVQSEACALAKKN